MFLLSFWSTRYPYHPSGLKNIFWRCQNSEIFRFSMKIHVGIQSKMLFLEEIAIFLVTEITNRRSQCFRWPGDVPASLKIGFWKKCVETRDTVRNSSFKWFWEKIPKPVDLRAGIRNCSPLFGKFFQKTYHIFFIVLKFHEFLFDSFLKKY